MERISNRDHDRVAIPETVSKSRNSLDDISQGLSSYRGFKVPRVATRVRDPKTDPAPRSNSPKRGYLASFERSASIIPPANFSIGMPEARDNFSASTNLSTFHSLIHR